MLRFAAGLFQRNRPKADIRPSRTGIKKSQHSLEISAIANDIGTFIGDPGPIWPVAWPTYSAQRISSAKCDENHIRTFLEW
jgi:hypothetical protein